MYNTTTSSSKKDGLWGKWASYISSQELCFWCVAVGVLTLYNLTPRLDSFDTPYYLLAGERLWHGEMDCLRTPVYPLLLQLCRVCFGDRGMGAAITVLQSVVYLVSIVSLRHVISRTIRHRGIGWVVAYLYVLAVAPGWCNEWLTESLSISGCIIFVDMLLRYMERPSIAKATAWGIVLFLLVFLRPTFVLFFSLLPCLWLWQWWQHHAAWRWHIAALGITIVVMGCFGLYCKSYEQHFGHFGATATFACNRVYDLKRSETWDLAAVRNPEARALLQDIDEHSTINYAPIYDAISQSPTAYPLIAEGCNDMVQAHKYQWIQYRIFLTMYSFDSRFLAAVNTHTPLSAFLFITTFLLVPSLWLFYCLCLCGGIYLIYRLLRHRHPNIFITLIYFIMLAQCVGIVLTTADSHNRLMLPVYPLFLILLGVAVEKVTTSIHSHK